MVIITEAYADRVNAVAQQVIDVSQHTPITPDQVMPYVDRYSSQLQVSDWLVGGKSRKDFQKDVVTALKGKVKWKRTPGAHSKTVMKRALQNLAEWLSQEFTDELGNTFPDGDPHDAAEAVIRRTVRAGERPTEAWAKRHLGDPELSLHEIMDVLTPDYYGHMHDWVWTHVWPLVQVKFAKDNQVRDAHEYLAQLWDQQAAQERAWVKTQSKQAQDDFRNSPWAHRNPYR